MACSTQEAKLIGDLQGLLLDRLGGGDFADHKYTHVLVDEYQDLTRESKVIINYALGTVNSSLWRFTAIDLPISRERTGGVGQARRHVRSPVINIHMTECRRVLRRSWRPRISS